MLSVSGTQRPPGPASLLFALGIACGVLPAAPLSAQLPRHTQIPGASCPADTTTVTQPALPDRGLRTDPASERRFLNHLEGWPRKASVVLSFWLNTDGSLDPCGVVVFQETDSLWTAQLLRHLPELKFSAPVAGGRRVRARVGQRFGVDPDARPSGKSHRPPPPA